MGDADPAQQQHAREPDGTFKKGVVQPGSKPFPPNVSGNPGGRPKGASILAPLLRKLAANPNPETGEGELAEQLADEYIEASLALARGVHSSGDGGTTKYDVTPILKLMERTDGAVTQRVETEKRKRIVIDLGDAPTKEPEA